MARSTKSGLVRAIAWHIDDAKYLSIVLIAVCLAALRAGMVVVNTNPFVHAAQLEQQLKDSGASHRHPRELRACAAAGLGTHGFEKCASHGRWRFGCECRRV